MKRSIVTAVVVVLALALGAAPAQAHKLTQGIAERYAREEAARLFEQLRHRNVPVYDYLYICSKPRRTKRGSHRHRLNCLITTVSQQSDTAGRYVATRIRVFFISNRSRELIHSEGKTFSEDFVFSDPPDGIRTPDQVTASPPINGILSPP